MYMFLCIKTLIIDIIAIEFYDFLNFITYKNIFTLKNTYLEILSLQTSISNFNMQIKHCLH